MRQQLLQKLSFGGKREIIANDQSANDIISAMLAAHTKYQKDYDLIADQFYAGSAKATAKKLFDFLKNNIHYKVESVNNQRIMSPGAIITLAQNDCKNFALFINGVLHSLKRRGIINNKILYRFVSYNILDPTPHHTYAVMIYNDGSEINIDPVLKSFNEKKLYYNKIDKMPLYAISGVSGIGAKKAAKAPKGVKRPIVARVALAPARGSFLLLVGLNFMGLATKLNDAFKNKKDATNTWWSKLGGNTNELLRKVEQGAKKKRIFGEDQEGAIGVVPAAAAASAAPILVKVATFLKSIGINPAEIANAGKKVLANQIRAKLEPKEKAATQAQEVAQMQTEEAVETLSQDKVSPSGLMPVTTEKSATTTKSSSKKYLPYVIGGGLALYLLTRKK
jgi:hypothetical protein